MPEQKEVQHAIEIAFRQHYDQLGRSLYQLLQSKEPQERQLGQLLVHLEYENLMTTLNLALADREYHFGDPKFIDVPIDHLLDPVSGSAESVLGG